MAKEKPELELNRLQAELRKAREDEVFVGRSSGEAAEYNRKAERIHELLGKIHLSTTPVSSWKDTKLQQKHQSKCRDTDPPDGEIEPYGSPETDSDDSSTNP
jgi:hypothetical protein